MEYFVGDSHLGHTNVLCYCRRPFKTIDEHDDVLIGNINKRVQANDTLFHIGDFAFAHAWAKKGTKLARRSVMDYRRAINCSDIILIMGNHDSHYRNGEPKPELKDAFTSIHRIFDLRATINDVRRKIVLCHYAMRVWNAMHYGSYHLYGHSHYSLPDQEYGKSMDVGVDAVAGRATGKTFPELRASGYEGLKAEDYRPLSIIEVDEYLSKKIFVPIDHHTGDDNESE